MIKIRKSFFLDAAEETWQKNVMEIRSFTYLAINSIHYSETEHLKKTSDYLKGLQKDQIVKPLFFEASWILFKIS